MDASETGASNVEVPPAKPPELFKLDWYQTESQVVLSILAKNFVQEKVKVEIKESSIIFNLEFKDGLQSGREIHLEKIIIPEKSTFKALTTKVELKLAKKDAYQWSKLEKEEEKKQPKQTKNWDKVAKEIDDDQQEGEAVLNALFQKIYSEGSDEVKKAMNKSFVESGGTELNTNWDAVKKGTVSVKPPDGMEWKKWDS